MRQRFHLTALGSRGRLRILPFILLLGGGIDVAAATLGQHVLLNVTPSMPLGIYLRWPAAAPERGDAVLFGIPPAVRALAAERNYLPASANLLKMVVAVSGDDVCLDGDTFDAPRAGFRSRISRVDSAGRPLRPYGFCGRVSDGALFVASPNPTSLDSRFFGPIAIADATVVRALWTF